LDDVPPKFIRDVFFWTFIVCEFVALWIFGGKMPDSTHPGNVWGYVVGGIGIICLISWRAISFARMSQSDGNVDRKDG
jgi:hypothetical protein